MEKIKKVQAESWKNSKKCRPRSDCSLGAVWSGSALFAVARLSRYSAIITEQNRKWQSDS